MPSRLVDIHDIEFIFEGKILAATNFKVWPYDDPKSNRPAGLSLITIEDSSDLYFHGQGQVDGQGFDWWIREFLVQNFQTRPCLFRTRRVRNFHFEGILVSNSPYYHFLLEDIDNFYIHDMEIYVDVFRQKNIHMMFGNWDFGISYPIFPLNTDGIDPSGTNVRIENVKITNYDDAVAVKPAHNTNKVATCA